MAGAGRGEACHRHDVRGWRRLFLNERHVDVAAAYAAPDIAWAEIGRYSWSPAAAGTWGVFDLYEMVVYATALSNADAQALSCAVVLTEPGTTHVSAGWRVINKGISGNKVSDFVARRDVANGWATQRLPGHNVVAFEIGRNDWAANITAS